MLYEQHRVGKKKRNNDIAAMPLKGEREAHDRPKQDSDRDSPLAPSDSISKRVDHPDSEQ